MATAPRQRGLTQKELDKIAVSISAQLGNSGSKIDIRLSEIEKNLFVLIERIKHPCPLHNDIKTKIDQMETKQGLLYPVISAIIGGTIVGAITIILRMYIK